jgi:hypothetical protein
MKVNDPRKQNTSDIVESLLTNTKRQYTESAHAEIYNRLIGTISEFNTKAERSEKFMMILAGAQVMLAIAQIVLAIQ